MHPVCTLSFIMLFVIAHIVAWSVLGGGWRGAGRAPFAVFFPALALVLLDAVWTDSYANLGATVSVLVSWELLYFFLYVVLRIIARSAPAGTQVLPRR
jgi:hypothetical protein